VIRDRYPECYDTVDWDTVDFLEATNKC